MLRHIVPRSAALHAIKLRENAGLSVLRKTWISSSSFTPDWFLVVFAAIAKFDFASSCISPSAWDNLAPTGQIFMKFRIEDFSKICREIAICINI